MTVSWLTGVGACGCECCPPAYLDTFHRADNADPGTEWTNSGWQIADNRLVATGAATAYSTYADADNSYTLIAEVQLRSDGDKFRLIAGRQDASNYVYAQVERIDADSVDLKAFKVQSGTHTQIGSTYTNNACPAAAGFRLKACWNGTAKRFGVEENDELAEALNGTLESYVAYQTITGTYGSGHGVEAVTVGEQLRVTKYALYDPLSENYACPACVGQCTCCSGGVTPPDGRIGRFYSVTIRNVPESDRGGGNIWPSHDGTYIVEIFGGCSGTFTIPQTGLATTSCTGTLNFACSAPITGCVTVKSNCGPRCWRTAVMGAPYDCEVDWPLVPQTVTEGGLSPCCGPLGGFGGNVAPPTDSRVEVVPL